MNLTYKYFGYEGIAPRTVKRLLSFYSWKILQRFRWSHTRMWISRVCNLLWNSGTAAHNISTSIMVFWPTGIFLAVGMKIGSHCVGLPFCSQWQEETEEEEENDDDDDDDDR